MQEGAGRTTSSSMLFTKTVEKANELHKKRSDLNQDIFGQNEIPFNNKERSLPPKTSLLNQKSSTNNLSRNGMGINFARNSYGSNRSIDRYTNGSSSSCESIRNLNLSDEKLANIKSPMYLKLQKMINTLGKFREEMDGSRVPKYEIAFLAKKKIEEKKKRKQDRQERK